MRAVLRDPEILILDEATANIDTVTEQLLEQILDQAARLDDEGHHRASPEHDRQRRRDLLHQRRRDHAGRLDGPRPRHAAEYEKGELGSIDSWAQQLRAGNRNISIDCYRRTPAGRAVSRQFLNALGTFALLRHAPQAT